MCASARRAIPVAANWIKGAIKHPGALHEQLGVPQGQKIPAKKVAAAAQKGGTLGRRARLAQTLSKMHHGKRKRRKVKRRRRRVRRAV